MEEKKFSMSIVWHNCLTYKPSEFFNSELFVTNGKCFCKVVYKENVGFVGDGVFIDDTCGKNWWWCDMNQTINEVWEDKLCQ